MGVIKDTVHNWIKKTNISAHNIGKFCKFKRSELDEWIKMEKVLYKSVFWDSSFGNWIMFRNLRKRKTMVRIDTLS